MKVFVLSKTGQPRMPTTPARARRWLKAKRACVVRREPFTIQLRFETTPYTQLATVGVDTGSKTIGLAATANKEVLFQAEMHLRTDISGKLRQRRQYRRTRRGRKTRYRAARWANRCRKAGSLSPSLASKAEATVKAVRFVARVLPIGQIHVEIGSFDTQKMQDPEISGIHYQQGQLEGYLLREYLLMKWKQQCSYCGARNVPLQIEHIIPKSKNGTDRASNLTIACASCNLKKGKQTAVEFGFPQVQAQAKVPLRWVRSSSRALWCTSSDVFRAVIISSITASAASIRCGQRKSCMGGSSTNWSKRKDRWVTLVADV